MEKYPIFLYPQIIVSNAYENYEIEVGERPVKPQEIKVADDRKVFFSTSFWIILVLVISIPILPEAIIAYNFFFIFIFIVYRVLRASLEKSEYQKKIDKNNSEFNQKMQYYKKELEEYEKEVIRKNRLENIKKNETGEIRKVMFLRELYKEKNIMLSDAEDIKEGVTEQSLYEALKGRFGSRILRKKGVTKDCLTYYPDLIYFDNVRQIYIDIEIDEPYDLISGEPIHISGDDDYRNEFFIENHWIVLRFTEYQIFTELKKCVATVEEIIRIFEFGLTKRRIFLQESPSWTEEDALEMERKSFRESYLGIAPIKRIQNDKKDASNTGVWFSGYDFDDDFSF